MLLNRQKQERACFSETSAQIGDRGWRKQGGREGASGSKKEKIGNKIPSSVALKHSHVLYLTEGCSVVWLTDRPSYPGNHS